jgi:hypothetical protein
VVVVASSGNEGQNPYMTGSPASGHGVLSVSAIDSTARFPGASLKLGSTTIPAINANGATLPTGSLTVVALTGDNELGCSTDAFTAAGIKPGQNQIAVVTRGTCGRVAKAVYGQAAGAAAVVMINNSAGYPPYEGTITSNPDTGEAANVTIPFLGVRSTDGAALLAQNGKALTLAAITVDNPSYKGYASFSSAGPASGDSSMSPNISAPGVSISSVAVGTGTDATVESGTSMAAPHVAGVAALAVQAHPKWRATDIAATLGSTADPDQVADYAPILGGGLVDAAQAVSTSTFATGDSYRTTSGRVNSATLSFGFDEPTFASIGAKAITITNRGDRPVTYTLSSTASDTSLPAKLKFSAKKVKVPARGTAKVWVSLTLPASSVGSSIGDDQWAFRQASGIVTLSSSAGTLTMPYLLVPRAQAQVVATVDGNSGSTRLGAATSPTTKGSASATPSGKGSPSPSPTTSPTPAPRTLTVRLANPLGALDADADFYTWGLSDARDLTGGSVGRGYDLRAAGVESFDNAADKLVVFAVNNYDRWSNAAANEYDVLVDTNGDGKPEWDVFSYDYGLLVNQDPNGLTAVFAQEVKTGDIYATGYYAQSPTDSSTILLPVDASLLGLTADAGAFTYSVQSFGGDGGSDAMPGTAAYNPWARAIADGDYVTVARNRSVKVSVAVDASAFASQKPKGLMVVVYDNHSGAREALLLGVR